MPMKFKLLRRRSSRKPTPTAHVYESSLVPPPYSEYPAQTSSTQANYSLKAAYEGEMKTWPSTETKEPIFTSGTEDQLKLLSQYDTVFVVDDSGSMRFDRRWEKAQEAIATLTKFAVKEDEDGIDIHFLNKEGPGLHIKTERDARKLFDFQPSGMTPLGMKLDKLLRQYERGYKKAVRKAEETESIEIRCKPVNFVVITDGHPSDDDVEDVIKSAAKRFDEMGMPRHQVGIQFVQIGNDPGVVEFLKTLDDGIAKSAGVRDMVDTIQHNPDANGDLTPEDLIKTLLGGINRREDNKNGRMCR